MTVLATSAAGFAGFPLASRLLRQGESAFGIDNLLTHYDVSSKEARLALLNAHVDTNPVGFTHILEGAQAQRGRLRDESFIAGLLPLIRKRYR